MKGVGTWHWWATVIAAAWMTVAGALAARTRLDAWTQSRLIEQLKERMATLPAERAAAEAHRLIALDEQAPALLVPLAVDRRDPVSTAARDAIEQLLADWRQRGACDTDSRIAGLAYELARAAPELADEHVGWAQTLAIRLLAWPVRDAEFSTRIVTDCELVLRLPLPEPSAARVAATARPVIADAMVEVIETPVPVHLPAPLPAQSSEGIGPPMPRVYGPVQPDRLPDASLERPERPKQFLPPRALRIDG